MCSLTEAEVISPLLPQNLSRSLLAMFSILDGHAPAFLALPRSNPAGLAAAVERDKAKGACPRHCCLSWPVKPHPELPHQGSMSISTMAVQKRTTQEQLKAAPLCFSFSTE